MALLEQYEHQYAQLIAETTAVIGTLQSCGGGAGGGGSAGSGVERRDLCTKIDANLTEAHELLEQMGLEIRDLNATQRPSATSKLNCAQVELKRLQNEYRKTKDARAAVEQHHALLDLGASGDNAEYLDDVSIGYDQRQRLLENSERIERTGSRLSEGFRVAIETEQLGAQVLNDLSHQRETLQGARARLRETNAEIGRASRTLNTMMLRALREKAVLYAVGVCFVVAVGVSLYLSFSPSASPEA